MDHEDFEKIGLAFLSETQLRAKLYDLQITEDHNEVIENLKTNGHIIIEGSFIITTTAGYFQGSEAGYAIQRAEPLIQHFESIKRSLHYGEGEIFIKGK